MKKIINKILCCVIMCQLIGCYASQRDDINLAYKQELYHLDERCKAEHMTQWCQMQYEQAKNLHDQNIAHDSKEERESLERGAIIGYVSVIVGLLAAAIVIPVVVAK